MGGRSISTKRSGLWGALAGAVGGLCCVGPSAAVLLGLGASSALAGFTLDRDAALTAGVALLAAGMVLILRPRAICRLGGAARWQAPALMLAAFALAYALIGVLLPVVAARHAEASTPSLSPDVPVGSSELRRATLLIEKMSCPPCAATVRGALKRDPAVRQFVAETSDEQVTIVYDGARTSVGQLAARFPRRYGVTVVSDVSLPDGGEHGD